MRTLLERLEALFESTGANAGHEFRNDPFRRRLPALQGLDAAFDTLAREACPGELLSLEAISIHPHALASVQPPYSEGLHIVWLLDEGRVLRSPRPPVELTAANPSD